MSKDSKVISFAQKFGVKGQGKPVRISEKTQDAVRGYYRRSAEIIEKGKEFTKREKRLFGGVPQPGEPGSEKFFTAL